MAGIPKPNAAVLAARSRRGVGSFGRQIKEKWFIEKTVNKIALTMRQRTGIATAFLKDKVIRNISLAVTKGTGPRGGRVVTNRSKSGEFPKADSTQLMKTIFSGVRSTGRKQWEGFVATPLDYGLMLETKMNRSFLQRSLRENRGTIKRILTGPIK